MLPADSVVEDPVDPGERGLSSVLTSLQDCEVQCSLIAQFLPDEVHHDPVHGYPK